MRMSKLGPVLGVAALSLALGACSDAGGENDVLVQSVDAAGECPNGGVRINAGRDLNGDGLLQAEEISSSELDCTELAFTLQLLHFADVDGAGGADDVRNFSALVNGFRALMPANTLVLSSGDNWIPGPEYFGAEDDRLDASLGANGPGRAHVGWLNALGVQASVVGNHELDLGTAAFAGLLSADGAYAGAQFPYLSANIDFGADSSTAGLVVPAGQPPRPNSLSASTVLTAGGQRIGVVGASTPTLPGITSVGGLVVTPADRTDIPALAAEIQAEVDALTATGINKVILLAHMQQIQVEQALAGLLRDVDIIVAGGSNTVLADANDRLRDNQQPAAGYPMQLRSASGEPVLLVNTDGDYRYLGRLVVGFDANGLALPQSVDPVDSGAYASDFLPFRNFTPLPAVVAIADALEAVLREKDGNILGLTEVFLEGRRSAVRSQETNLGNLTADANLWYARQTDPLVQVSLKNGGGIRAEVGLILQPPGTTDPALAQFLPPLENASSGKPSGGISQLDLQTTLRFNNGLVTLSVTAAELADIIEHGVSGANPGSTPGSFPQVGGIRFSFDPSRTARSGGDLNRGTATVPSRVRELAIVDDSGAVIDQIVVDGQLQGDLSRRFRIVTLNFLAEACVLDASASCGDGYPYKGLSAPELIDLDGAADPGLADFSPTGGEQDALAEYLLAFHAQVPYAEAEQPAAQDRRIQNLSFERVSSVFSLPLRNSLTRIGRYQDPNAGFDEGAAEIVAYHAPTRRLFVINAQAGSADVLDIANPANPQKLGTVDAVVDLGGNLAGINSVAVSGNIVAFAVEADPKTANGRVAFYNATSLALLGSVEVGALPDMVAFTPDGSALLVANEGEAPADPADDALRDFANDVPGTVSLVDLRNGVAAATVTNLDFIAFNVGGSRAGEVPADLRREPGASSLANDLEPEYIVVNEAGTKAYVSLQEANAIAVIDIPARRVDSLIALGRKDHGRIENALDASDRDGISIQAEAGIVGLHMPDGLAVYRSGGVDYVLTANEGDSRDDVDECGIDDFSNLDAIFAGREGNEELGRLDLVCNQGRDTNGDGLLDQLAAFGARSFSVVGPEGIVYDSGDDFERVLAHLDQIDGRTVFNASNTNNTRENRSDNKGPEPEAVVVASIDGVPYSFIGLERDGGIMVYDMRNPRLPRFVDYVNNRDFSQDPEDGTPGDLGPEGLVFIPAALSPNGQNLLVVGNEISGSTTIYRVDL